MIGYPEAGGDHYDWHAWLALSHFCSNDVAIEIRHVIVKQYQINCVLSEETQALPPSGGIQYCVTDSKSSCRV